ncbi:MAG: GNAT family N-acetyltransferase [Lachnospiraceae bacterium]|nr:GNAT family N-acetyltransferase [Lachnospiraceae bacterium]
MFIRNATAGDIPGILTLLHEVLELHAEIRPDIFISGTTKYTKEELEEILKDKSKPIYVAVDEKENVIGYAFCQLKEPAFTNTMHPNKEIFIDDFCIDENTRGNHVGQQLFEYVKKEAEKYGCFAVTLNVWAGNEGAEKFYEKMGMKTRERMLEYILQP